MCIFACVRACVRARDVCARVLCECVFALAYCVCVCVRACVFCVVFSNSSHYSCNVLLKILFFVPRQLVIKAASDFSSSIGLKILISPGCWCWELSVLQHLLTLKSGSFILLELKC